MLSSCTDIQCTCRYTDCLSETNKGDMSCHIIFPGLALTESICQDKRIISFSYRTGLCYHPTLLLLLSPHRPCLSLCSLKHSRPVEVNNSRQDLRQRSPVKSEDKGLITMRVSTYQSSMHHSCVVKLC